MGVRFDSAASGSDPGGLEGALVCSLGVSGFLFGAPGCLQASKMTPRTPKFFKIDRNFNGANFRKWVLKLVHSETQGF